MQRKRLTMCAVLLLGMGLTGMQAQESINASGGDATGTAGSVSYSLGQVTYTTQDSSTGSVAQGVQQAFEISVLGVEDLVNKDIQLAAYPNPTSDFLKLLVKEDNLSDLSFQMFDAQGRLLLANEIKDQQTLINMSSLPTATYFIKVSQAQKPLKTFKILKK
ncbi:T9SS type A sorting domain-containing protein [Weeksellaceae bacterium KMM 9713]|uniref:T9SS type A sorting domain-containing protein n=1 Tax=Profundicola chukchiensis TaxID=2961959 RepID=A0A9X4MZH8_9FLAO|nr:T9SS type A sorting domain-containing protein [Profundicola chukchiensis]MDG4945695.1 T9SS type A sorting domain-containing protein [Profundicola chukchiensis]